MAVPTLISAQVHKLSGTFYLATVWDPGTTVDGSTGTRISVFVDVGGPNRTTLVDTGFHSSVVDVQTGHITLYFGISSQNILEGQTVTCTVPASRVRDSEQDQDNTLTSNFPVTNESTVNNPWKTWGGRAKPSYIDKRSIFR